MADLMRAAAAAGAAVCVWAVVTWLQVHRRLLVHELGPGTLRRARRDVSGLRRLPVAAARRLRALAWSAADAVDEAAAVELILLTLAAELDAGAPLQAALQRVGGAAPGETGRLLRECLETELPGDGIPVVRLWGERSGDPVLQDLAATLEIQRGTGGSLSPVLRRVAEISRRRRLLGARLRSRTVEARLSAAILAVAPLVLAGFVGLRRPESLAPLWSDAAGRLALVYAAASWLVGIGWLRAMLAATGRVSRW